MEDGQQHGEFPDENGLFHLSDQVTRYKVCGDDINEAEVNPPPKPPAWNTPFQWSQSAGNSNSQRGGRMPFGIRPQQPGHSSGPSCSYETAFFKRCLPLVSLSLSKSGRNITVDNTEDNVFVKIPESTLSVSTILSEVGKKTSLSPDELVLLDSKLILIADDKGQFGLKIIIYNYN